MSDRYRRPRPRHEYDGFDDDPPPRGRRRNADDDFDDDPPPNRRRKTTNFRDDDLPRGRRHREAQEDFEDDPRPRGRRRMQTSSGSKTGIIVFLMLFLVLGGGGGVGVWLYLQSRDEAKTGENGNDELPKKETITTIMDEIRNATLPRAIAWANKHDPKWKLMELDAARPAPPVGKNGAQQLYNAYRQLKPVERFMRDEKNPVYKRFTKNPNKRISKLEYFKLETDLKQMSRALTETFSLLSFPQGKFKLSYTNDFFNTKLPHVNCVRNVCNLAQLAGHYHVFRGELDQGLKYWYIMVYAESYLGKEPSSLVQLVRCALREQSFRFLECWLAQNRRPNTKQLAHVQQMLEHMGKENLLLTMLRGERAGIHHFLTNVAAGKANLGQVEFTRGVTPTSVQSDHAFMLQYMNRAIKYIQTEPTHLWKKNTDYLFNGLIGKLPPITRALLPDIKAMIEAQHRHLTFMRTAMAAIARERYALEQKPEVTHLSGAIPEFLKSWPEDPKTGKRLFDLYCRPYGNAVTANDNDNTAAMRTFREFKRGFRVYDPKLRAIGL